MSEKQLIQKGCMLYEIRDIDRLTREYELWSEEVCDFFEKNRSSPKAPREIKTAMHFTKNEYSEADTRQSIVAALDRAIRLLRGSDVSFLDEIPRSAALGLIERILENFYLYYRAMYKNPVHKKGTLAQETVGSVKIGNEYDLQRMLYSLLLPLFPTARQETAMDSGYGGMRADIYLKEYDVIIETKRTRETMSEKKLLEELGADAFYYQADTIFFFVYDPQDIIKNPAAMEKFFEKEKDRHGKNVRLLILQPRIL